MDSMKESPSGKLDFYPAAEAPSDQTLSPQLHQRDVNIQAREDSAMLFDCPPLPDAARPLKAGQVRFGPATCSKPCCLDSTPGSTTTSSTSCCGSSSTSLCRPSPKPITSTSSSSQAPGAGVVSPQCARSLAVTLVSDLVAGLSVEEAGASDAFQILRGARVGLAPPA